MQVKATKWVRPLGAMLALALAVLGVAPAKAAPIPRDEGFMKEPKSVQNRRYALDGKSDIGLFGTLSIKNQLTEHYGAVLTFDKQLSEYFAIDLMAGGGYGGFTSLADKLRDSLRPSSGTVVDDLADAGSLLATGQLGLRFTPVYGKLNLSAELPVHFNAYFVAGVGGALVHYESVLACAKNRTSSKQCPGDVFRSSTSPTLGVNVGGGFRFYLTEKFSARVEVRDVMFPDKYNERVNLMTPGSTPGTPAANPGITHTPLIMIGAGFML